MLAAIKRWAQKRQRQNAPKRQTIPQKKQHKLQQQSGYSAATLPEAPRLPLYPPTPPLPTKPLPPPKRRKAARFALPVWAALLLLTLAVLTLIGGIVFGSVRLVQWRRAVAIERLEAESELTAVAPTPVVTPTLVPEPEEPLPDAFDLTSALADSWPSEITQWSDEILISAEKHGLDPNLLAAIIEVESDGIPDGVSYAGAVGLMGIMPRGSGSGLDDRPTAATLVDPATNVEWGAKILGDYFRQTEGDLFTALTVYNGGWVYAHTTGPQQYAAGVLDLYARAMIKQAGLNVRSDQWTIGLRQNGEVSAEPLISNAMIKDGWPLYAKHTLVIDGQPITAYAIPLQNTVSSE